MKIWMILVASLIVVSSQKGYSWGDEGHSVTALTAQSILAIQSRNGDVQATATLKALGQILGQTKITDAALWPDKVKQLSRQCNTPPLVKDPNYGSGPSQGQSSAICDAYKYTANWHYISAEGTYTPNPNDPNYFKGDTVVLINGLTHVLKNEPAPSLNGVKSYTNWKTECLKKPDHACKKEALAFLLHLVGDIHQPLHSGSSCDVGGNSQYITFFGQPKDPAAFWCNSNSPASCTNHELHQAWDTSILVLSPNNQAFSVPDYVSKLIPFMANKVSSSDPKKCVPVRPNMPVDVDKSNGPVSWANESLCYMDQVYAFSDDPTAVSPSIGNRCRADKKVDENGRVAFSSFAVGKNYYQTNLPTINERLYWGGFRLATLLKTIYGTGDKVSELQP